MWSIHAVAMTSLLVTSEVSWHHPPPTDQLEHRLLINDSANAECSQLTIVNLQDKYVNQLKLLAVGVMAQTKQKKTHFCYHKLNMNSV